jgi:hypothetical protein
MNVWLIITWRRISFVLNRLKKEYPLMFGNVKINLLIRA